MIDKQKFQEFCERMYFENQKERRDYGEKEYKDFDMYYKYNKDFLKDYYNNKEVK